MNHQEIFDTITKHLITQGKKSQEDEPWNAQEMRFNPNVPPKHQCLYLDAHGNKCAVGALIPDGHPAQQSKLAVEDLLGEHKDLKGILGICTEDEFQYDKDVSLLTVLQRIHDNMEPHEWPEALKHFAEFECLELPECIQ